MAATSTKTGFFGDDSHTVYVTPSGKVWCVQSDDLVELPRKWDSLPEGFAGCGDLMTPDEAEGFLSAIREEFGEDATA